MSRPRRFAPAIETGAVLALGVAAIYASLLPYSLDATSAPAPDLLYCLVAAWVVRRPAKAPLWAILALALAGDVFLSRPIGLGALGLLLAAEGLRANAFLLRGAPFMLEWLVVAVLYVTLQGAINLVLEATFTNGPGFRALLVCAGRTALAYPVIVLVLNIGPRIDAARRGPAADRLGRIP
jgi:rod shape-determining protein MreD